MDEAIRAGKISALSNLMLTVVKGIAGLAVGSTALVADAIHSLIDVLSSLFVWIGIKISTKPPDKEHPYGHFKAESLAELSVGIAILFTAFIIIHEAVLSLINKHSPEFEFYAVLAAVFSAVVNEILARYKIRVGLKTRSTSLIAEGKHSRVDVITSISVVFGLAFSAIGYWWADAVVAIAISVLIMQIAGQIMKNSIDVLMDKTDE